MRHLPPVAGSAVGLTVRSSLPFETLRTPSGETELLVEEAAIEPPRREPLAVWEARPANPFHATLHRRADRYLFSTSDAGRYEVDPATGWIGVDGDAEPLRRELRLFGIPAALCALHAGDLSIHASAVDVDGAALLLAGPSMHGKTTLAAGFAAAGHRLLAEDTVRCRIGAVPALYPGPAAVRLRPDVANELRLPGAYRAGGTPDAGRQPMIFDAARRGDGRAAPLRGIILLRGGDDVGVKPLDAADATRDLFALSFRLPTDESRRSCFARVVDLTARVPAYDLHRPLSMAAMPAVVDRLERLVGGRA